MVFGFAVAASGYESGAPVTEGMRTLIWGACTVVPAASALLAIVPLLRYAVDERTLPARLAQSRAARTARPSLSTPHPGAARE